MRGLLVCLSLIWSGVAGAEPAFIDLPVPGHELAVVSVPNSELPRPVLVATHGSFDHPEWHCTNWRQVFGDQLFVLCPRGTLRWDSPQDPEYMRYYYRSVSALEKEIDAGLEALRARFGARVAPGPLLYLGFSQGAIYGAPLVAGQAARYPRIVLVEGGTGLWNQATARAYARGGGLRVLLACGRPICVKRAQAAARLLEQAGVKAKVVFGDVGHHYDGVLAEQIRAAVPWLLEGDQRFSK